MNANIVIVGENTDSADQQTWVFMRKNTLGKAKQIDKQTTKIKKKRTWNYIR